ncbi:MAG: PQQ-dependent sugar dehydrogenase [Candidatus Paceibacterota bacterium]
MTQRRIIAYSLIVIGVVAIAFITYAWRQDAALHESPQLDNGVTVNGTTDAKNNSVPTEVESLSIVAENLEIPWDIAFLPDDSMLVTERPGRVVHIESGRTYLIEGVEHVGEGGLMGITLHPDFENNKYIYLYQTTRTQEGLRNRVVRYTYVNENLSFERVIIDALPSAPYHDGGRIEFGPDDMLYVTVGDATNESAAQDPNSLAGSILRIHDDGSIPDDNPFNNAVYSYGHRNPQGLAWDDAGRLWSTEHGRSGAQSGLDEINLIESGQNYGWPESEGNTVQQGTVGPEHHSGASDTWAPASAVYQNGSIFFGGLRGAALYEAVLREDEVIELKEHFKGEFGRIRSVRLGPEGYLYLTTSNRDDRGNPSANDDRIIRVHPSTLN